MALDLSLKLINNVDDRTKLLVHGYLRNLATTSETIEHTPLCIASICILFFRDIEIFDIIEGTAAISEDGKCVTAAANSYEESACLGLIKIPSTNNDIKCEWNVQIKQPSSLDYWYPIGIGITSNIYRWNTMSYQSNGTKHEGESKTLNEPQYGATFSTNDTISVCLDLETRELRFKKNGIDQGVAFQNVKKLINSDYVLYVSLSHGASVEILGISRY